MDTLWRDIRHGLRLMLQTPVISLAAILSLALGTGANTAIFSLLDALVFRDLPVHAPQDLLVLKWSVRTMPKGGYSNYGTNDRIDGRTVNWSFTPPLFEALRKPSPAVSGVAAFNDTQSSSIKVRGQAVTASGNFVSGEFFEVTGVSPHAGRLITTDDDRPEAPPAVVISYRLWKDRFAGELSAISEIVQINGHSFTVIGIAPPEFNGVSEDRPDFYVPVATQPLVYPQLQGRDPNLFWLQLVARKRPEATREQAQAGLNTVFLRNLPWQNLTAAETPTLDADPGSQGYDFLRRQYAQPLWVLMTLVGLLLLIACTNIANLLLARGAARHNENAIRAALGAGRARLMRQYLTESFLLAITGGVAGLLVARFMRDLLLTFLPATSRLALEAQLDWRVFGFTLTIALLTGFLFGLAPAWKAARIDPGPALALGPRIATSGWGSGGWRRMDAGRMLVLGQVALSLMLLVAAGLFLGSLRRLQQTRLGFNPENLLLFRVNAIQAGHKRDDLIRFHAAMIERISALPGVRSATYSLYAMIGGGSWATSGLRIIGQPPLERDLRNTRVLPVGPRFFETMETPLLLGRLFDGRDQANSPKVAVVNERWVRLYTPNTSPIGHKFTLSRSQTDTVEVVGVVRNARYNTLQGDEPAITYFPYAQTPSMYPRDANFAVRSAAAPESIIPSVRQAVRSLDPNLPLAAVRTQVEQINTHLQQQRVFAMLSVCFAALAALLAAIGLYGVMAYAVSRRTSEIGVRMAFGATRGNVAWLILRDVSAVLAAGIAVGVAGAIGTSTLVESSLYQVAPTDPPTILGAAVLMAVVALGAGYLPARRAARLDPMTALRHE